MTTKAQFPVRPTTDARRYVSDLFRQGVLTPKAWSYALAILDNNTELLRHYNNIAASIVYFEGD